MDRNESLAASLGAKLTGPRILKGIERFFDGPVKTSPPQPFASANVVTWLDVVTFAKANQTSFSLTVLPNGARCCRFVCKGFQVEISEDDWRLIISGALDRFPLEHPFEEDETAELVTLEILEQRAAMLYKKADEVAARARILNHKLGHRKQVLGRRQETNDGSTGGKFQAVNHPQRNSGFAGGSSTYDLHADLLQQFASAAVPASASAPASAPPSRSTSGAGVSVVSLGQLSPRMDSPHQHRHPVQLAPAAAHVPHAAEITGIQTSADSQVEIFRPLITSKIEKLSKGDTIKPPCDRCRRLRLQCVKHLTACQGCTKKHAKCGWKSVTEEEVSSIKYEMGFTGTRPGAGAGTSGKDETPGEVEQTGPRDISGAGRSRGATFDGMSRPASRAGNEISYHHAVYSPDASNVGRPATTGPDVPKPPQQQRFSAGPSPPVSRDQHQPRMNQIANLITPPEYNRQRPRFGGADVLPKIPPRDC